MAKQAEGFLVGTYDDITFYKMEGQYYARRKSSLTGKKFWKHKAFEGSRRSCGRFGRGNQLASLVYNEIAEGQRQYELYCRMKREAIAMLKAGKAEEEVIASLRVLKPKTEVQNVVCKPKVVFIPADYTGGLFHPAYHGNYKRNNRNIRKRGIRKLHQPSNPVIIREPDG